MLRHPEGTGTMRTKGRKKLILLKLNALWDNILPTLHTGLSMLIVVGIFAYIIRYIGALINHEPVTSPIELAAIAAMLGGFILVGAFYKDNTEPDLGRDLKRIAKLFLAAAVYFTITFILLEAVGMIRSPTLGVAERILVYITALSMLAAGITFSLALASLIFIIRRL